MTDLIKKRGGYISEGLLLVVTIFYLGIAGCDISGENPGDEESLEVNNGDEPYGQTDYQWYKGNLHAHSYWGNGYNYPEMVLDWYKNEGYNFAVTSPHNALQEGEKWVDAPKGSHAEKMFSEYLDTYGESWVEYEDQDSLYRVRLKPLEEYRPMVEETGDFMIYNSEEIDYEEGNTLIHVNATNIQEVIEPQPGGTVTEVLQNTIDAVFAQSERLGVSIIPQVNHPNINWSISAEDLKPLEGLRFFEVYNGHPNARNSGDTNHQSTEEVWDEVNTHYLANGKKPLFGLAVDDAHWYDIDYNNPGRGWIQVQSSVLSGEAILEALERGDFYASTGVRLSDLNFDGETLSIKIDAENGVTYTTKFIGTKKEETENPGIVLAEINGPEAAYSLAGDELYVRAKIISDKIKQHSSEEGEVEVAWVQPVRTEVSAN